MKFAKFLEEEAIPEWRPKFIKYKLLKEKLHELLTATQMQTNSPGDEVTDKNLQKNGTFSDSIPMTAQLKRASLFVVRDFEGRQM